MEDVQSQSDPRGVHVDQAGVRDLQYPITLLDPMGVPQRTIATATIAVGVPHHVRGTHMSRLVEVLDHHAARIDPSGLSRMLADLCDRLEASAAFVDLRFVYAVRRPAPMTGATAYATFDSWLIGQRHGSHEQIITGVRVPVTTLCPCSKAISDYGAHNQRGMVTLEASSSHPRPSLLSTLIEIAETSSSAPVYPLVKRPDERQLTMQAFDHPVFVEDIVRGCALRLQATAGIRLFRVEATNYESIHNHNAFAMVGWTSTIEGTNGGPQLPAFTVDRERDAAVEIRALVRPRLPSANSRYMILTQDT